MKNLFAVVFTMLLFVSPTLAQNNDVTESDYERLFRNYLKVEFRELAIESMDLTKEEITDFTPLYMKYMDKKYELVEKRNRLIEKHAEEMQEDDSAKEKADETADFIENYWEVDIAELELKKDFFDRFEDVIPYKKAVNFFILEENLINRVRTQSEQSVSLVPMIMKIQPAAVTYNTKDVNLEKYNNFMINIEGNVSLGHEYTHDGLTKLVNAISAMAENQNIGVPNMKKKKAEIMMLADELTKNWKSEKHADKAARAFALTADMLQAINAQVLFDNGSKMINDLQTAANKIDPSVLMTDQADHVRAFFQQAQKTVNAFARQANMKAKPSMNK